MLKIPKNGLFGNTDLKNEARTSNNKLVNF